MILPGKAIHGIIRLMTQKKLDHSRSFSSRGSTSRASRGRGNRGRDNMGRGSKPSGRRQPQVKTSWDPLAEWYDGWMGQEGSKHHRLVLPTVLELLDLSKGDRVLDLGCGQGVLAKSVAQAGAEYVGVDASERLIGLAKQRHGDVGQFLIGDVTKLHYLDEIQPESFEAAIFLLSIADIDDLDKAILAAANALKPKGKLIILMTHPAFRIPRQSGWGYDEPRKLQFRRVEQYLTPNKIPLKEYPGQQSGVSMTFHRPLQAYFAAFRENGLVVDDLREISTSEWITPQTRRAQARAVREIPLFLALRARK